MKFTVSIENPGRGSYLLGLVESESKKEAQQIVVQKLVSVGIPIHKIGLQVSDFSTLHVNLSTISIVQIDEFDEKKSPGLGRSLVGRLSFYAKLHFIISNSIINTQS